MGVNTAAGAALLIGTTAANGATDTYVAIGQVQTIPEFGRVYAEIKFNPIANCGTQKFRGSYDDGNLAVILGKDTSDAGQLACIAALATDFDYNFKTTANDANPSASSTVTVTVAAPGVVTWTAHGLPAGTAVQLTTTGVLPTGLSLATNYYVTAPSTNTFTLSATLAAALAGGSAITTTGAGSGVNTATTFPTATYQIFKAKVLSYTTKYDTVAAVIMATLSLSITSGSLVETARLP